MQCKLNFSCQNFVGFTGVMSPFLEIIYFVLNYNIHACMFSVLLSDLKDTFLNFKIFIFVICCKKVPIEVIFRKIR